MIRFGKCECCSVLKEEIHFLRSLVQPKAEPLPDLLPRITFEADQILSGSEEQHDLPPSDEQRRQAAIDSEAAGLLSGTYGNDY